MRVYIEREEKGLSLEFRGTAGSLLKRLKINPETVIVVRDDALIPLETRLKSGDDLKILSVISGG
ncbi:MAG: MoaD/ThiS family protein [archaeon]